MGSHRTNINSITTTETTTNKEAGKMARSGVPVTMRNILNDDPFFKNTWEDFDKLTEGMFSEPWKTRKRFDQDFRNHTSTSMQKSSQQTFSREERKESTKENSSMTRHNTNSRHENGWLTPQCWMMPGLNSKLPKSLDSLKTDEDENKMEVRIDTSQYRPDELKVSVEKGVVTVEGNMKRRQRTGVTWCQEHFPRGPHFQQMPGMKMLFLSCLLMGSLLLLPLRAT